MMGCTPPAREMGRCLNRVGARMPVLSPPALPDRLTINAPVPSKVIEPADRNIRQERDTGKGCRKKQIINNE